MPPWSHPTILSWAGMRGVVSLAAALALPAEFPSRNTILFLAFCAILALLVLQGTTLGPLIRRMGPDEPEDELLNPAVTPDAIDARSESTVAAMAAVPEKIDDADPEQAAVAGDLLRDLGLRAKQADQIRQDAERGTQRLEMQLRLRLTAIEPARAKLLADHKDELDTGAIGTLVAELDREEQQIRTAFGER